MFCTSCGKEIINTARFCNFCGRPVTNVSAASSPVSPPIQSPSSVPTAPYSAPMPEDVLSERSDVFPQNTEEKAASETPGSSALSMPETNGAAEAVETNIPSCGARQMPYVGAYPAAGSAYPIPNVIPQSGSGVSGAYSASTGGISGAPGMTAAKPSKPERERKYTLGHILLCLAAVAVMAITAGVFAGLYFSVV